MIKIENIEVVGWESAIRGMRNPMNSWEKSDSGWRGESYYYSGMPIIEIGPNDLDLMMRLAKGGSTHAKYRRMIVCYLDVTAPLYWWKEADTYTVGKTQNSCSTMHKIHAKEFELDDFSHEHLIGDFEPIKRIKPADPDYLKCLFSTEKLALRSDTLLMCTIEVLNFYREKYLETKDKKYWWQMIQLLPSSYNQRRTLMLNYEVLSHMYHDRKEHKLDEWREFCEMIRTLPCSQIITLEENK